MKYYIELLESNQILRRLSTIQLIAYFGAWFSNVAIYTLLLEMKVSAEIVAFVAMLHFLAGVIQAPFSGVIIDSFKPKKIMLTLVSIEIFSTFCLTLVHSLTDLWLLYFLIFIKMSAASFYFTTEMSLLPKLLEGNKLQKANELHSIIWSFSYTLGMAISGFVVFYFGTMVAFILDALMFVVAFFMLYSLKIDINIIETEEKLLEMIQDTFKYLQKNKVAMHLMLLHAFLGFTAFDALVALMVNQYYSTIIAVSLALGLLHSARAIGLVVGPLIISRKLNNKLIVFMFIGQALAIFLWATLMYDFYLSLFASIIVGLFSTTLWSYTYTLLQTHIEEKYYGRVVSYNDMLFLSTAAFTSFMIGYLAERSYSLEIITIILGCCFIVAGLYFAWLLKTKDIKEL